MQIVEILFFAALATLAAIICYRTIRIMHIARWRQMIIDELKGGCDSIGFVGCSVIAHDITNIKDIELLLSSTYNRYEVIIMLNSIEHSETFRQIVKHYHLTRVNHTQTNNTIPHITNLYRSASRTYRRLVLIDYSSTDIYSVINSAIEFTSYDYIIPLLPNTSLLPNAIENIAITLSDTSIHDIELILNNTIAQCCVFQRDSLMAHGGLSSNIISKISRNSVVHSDIALAYKRDTKCTSRFIATIIATISLCAIAYSLSTHAAIAFIVTVTLAVTASHFILQQWLVPHCSIMALLYQIRNLTTFFRPRKFNIS